MPSDRILVVDDEEPIREIVSSMLSFANYQCRQAASGLEALALLDSGEEFELMLSDLMMAELDGIGLLERTKERYPDMPVVMVTAVHDISVALAAIRNGAYDYLLKPFEREQLLATVRRAGAPYDLSPGALSASLMLTTGGMTGRLDKLERAGLLERRRGAYVIVDVGALVEKLKAEF